MKKLTQPTRPTGKFTGPADYRSTHTHITASQSWTFVVIFFVHNISTLTLCQSERYIFMPSLHTQMAGMNEMCELNIHLHLFIWQTVMFRSNIKSKIHWTNLTYFRFSWTTIKETLCLAPFTSCWQKEQHQRALLLPTVVFDCWPPFCFDHHLFTELLTVPRIKRTESYL